MRLQIFGGWMTWESSTYRSGTGELFTPCVLRSITVSPQPSCFENIMASTMARSRSSTGVNGCQGTPWSEELDGKELHGALDDECDLEPRGSAISQTSSKWSIHLLTYTSSLGGIMLILKGWRSSFVPL